MEQYRTDAQAAQPATLKGEDSANPPKADLENFPRGVVDEGGPVGVVPAAGGGRG
jgi:hypothetical protein